MINVKSWIVPLLLILISTPALANGFDNPCYNQRQKSIIGNDNKKIKNNLIISRLNASDLRINGKNYAEIPLGDSLEVTFTFFPGRSRAELSAYADLNNNGILDDQDKLIIKPVEVIDGDISDIDKTKNGKYKTSFSYVSKDNIPVNAIVGRDVFIFINDGIYQGSATIKVKAPASNFPVIGSVISPFKAKNLAVIATMENDPEHKQFMTFTDENGRFYIELPFNTSFSYKFTSKDVFNLLNDAYFQPEPVVLEASANQHSLTLTYAAKKTFIKGQLHDENGKPVIDASVFAEDINGNNNQTTFTAKTDSSGSYKLGVKEGIYKVGINAASLFPNYLFTDAIDSVTIKNGDVLNGVNFNLFSADKVISGRVTIDDRCAKDVYVAAWSNLGSVWQKTNSEGKYFLKVNSGSKYNIEVNPGDVPSGHVALNSAYRNIDPGASNINFLYAKTEIKVVGNVFDDSGRYVPQGVCIAATDGTHTFETQTDSRGHYSFSGISGSYYISVSRGNQFYKQVDTILIATTGIYHIDFHLEKISELSQQNIDQPAADLVIQHHNAEDNKPGTVLKYTIAQNSHVTLQLFDATGNKIATLENRTRPAGVYEVNMNTLNLSNGIYQCRLKAGSASQTRKFIFIK